MKSPGVSEQTDIRQTALFHEAQSLYERLRQPGTGQLTDAADVHASPDGRSAVFTGMSMDNLESSPSTRICAIDLERGDVRVLTFGPHSDRQPKYSPDGRRVAFLSDRHGRGDFQLYLLDPDSGAARFTKSVDGWVEYLHWSPDGRRILLGVAGKGADISGGQGAVTSKGVATDAPSWVPTVETANETCRWRRAWIYELASGAVRQVSGGDLNVWEASWCGNENLVAVGSPGPGEGLWYSARLHLISVESGHEQLLYAPQSQLGWPAASPSGEYAVVVESIASDRWVMAGDLRLLNVATGEVRPVDTGGIDVSCVEWRSDRQLLLAGHREFDSVVALFDLPTGRVTEVWRSSEVTTGGFHISVSGLGEEGSCVLVGESFVRAPEIAVVRSGEYRCVKSFDPEYAERARAIASVEQVRWRAADGLEIHGWLLLPRLPGPHPVLMNVHGGPVGHSRPRWLGRSGAFMLMLLERGCAVFFPNPRGSSGRGQEYIRHVVGDMGGADTFDLLAGLDHLVSEGIADPHRLGVTGASYGGFMTSWLISQDPRFAAAIPVAPTSNQVTQHLISNIPHFVKLFLADDYRNPNGKYFQRSPIMHAHKVKTPTLNICGALDRCTPPEEAVQFHNALLEHGAISVLVTYPEEGHGIRKFPAAIDYAARVVDWFERHMRKPSVSVETGS